jgi:hypothetical protein
MSNQYTIIPGHTFLDFVVALSKHPTPGIYKNIQGYWSIIFTSYESIFILF